MKTERYHTIGARRNPAEIYVIERDLGQKSLAISKGEMQRVADAMGAIVPQGGKMCDEGFDRFLACAKRHHEVEVNEVKH